MSINNKQNVRCPKCGQLNDITVWNSITVKDSPDLKEDLLKGRVNIFRCSVCAHTAIMPTPLLYNDEDKKLMISFSPCDDPLKKDKLYSEIKSSSKASGELKRFEGYNLRFVTDFNAFLEKILIFDLDLNDKVIEVIKFMILSQEIEKSNRRVCRFGKMDGGVMEFMIHDSEENQIYTSQVPKETYDTLWKSLRDSGVKPYSFDWEIVDGAYAGRLLNGFNNNK
ncbi:MAG: CpXC domain-containing protein [Firmicutes bacterium]|nr:CpXC domain-containing protein [Bacillota bacterium]